METKVYKEYSNCLGRDMEFKVYGHGGKPVLVVPSQNGRYFDFENFGMVVLFSTIYWYVSSCCWFYGRKHKRR